MLANSKPLPLFKEGFRNRISIAYLMRHLNVLLSVARTFVLLESTECPVSWQCLRTADESLKKMFLYSGFKHARSFANVLKYPLKCPRGRKSYPTMYRRYLALFGIPINEAIPVVRAKLEDDLGLLDRCPLDVPQLTTLLEMCLSSTYFTYQNDFYKQKQGAAWGLQFHPLWPISTWNILRAEH